MPKMPTPGTDAHRLLEALLNGEVKNPNRRLNLMAHSRASDLRKLGWKVSVRREPNRRNPRKPHYIYALES